MAEGGEMNQLPIMIKEWMQVQDELDTLSAAIREKRKRLATIRGMILTTMKSKQIGRLNISAGALTARTTKVKGAMTKKYISTALVDFFNGDKEKAAACAKFLEEHRPLKSKDNLALEPKD